MNGRELCRVLEFVTTRLEADAEEFRSLDAAVGDGDLGVTVAKGAAAVRGTVADQPDDTSVADVMAAAAKAFATANPSTFSALVAAGLRSAAQAVGEDPVGVAGAAAAARAFLDTVADKGKAQPGDKTMLDAVQPSVEALEAQTDAGATGAASLEAAVAAARQGVEESAGLVSRKGRARWVGERTRGHPDPGGTVYLRFLEAWRDRETSAR